MISWYKHDLHLSAVVAFVIPCYFQQSGSGTRLHFNTLEKCLEILRSSISSKFGQNNLCIAITHHCSSLSNTLKVSCITTYPKPVAPARCAKWTYSTSLNTATCSNKKKKKNFDLVRLNMLHVIGLISLLYITITIISLNTGNSCQWCIFLSLFQQERWQSQTSGLTLNSKACRWKLKSTYLTFFYFLFTFATLKCFTGNCDKMGYHLWGLDLNTWLIQYITCKSIFEEDSYLAFDQGHCRVSYSFRMDEVGELLFPITPYKAHVRQRIATLYTVDMV